MTLLNAPAFDRIRNKERRNLLIGVLFLCGAVAIFAFLCWNLPAEQCVNQFFAAVEAQDFPKAFGIWNHDPNWQQHTQQYAQSGYTYGHFLVDWDPASDYGRITSHKVLHSTSRYGNNTLLAVEINGRKTALLALAVGKSTHTMSFSPFDLTPMKNGLGWIDWQINYH
jgi:hypothetical protein